MFVRQNAGRDKACKTFVQVIGCSQQTPIVARSSKAQSRVYELAMNSEDTGTRKQPATNNEHPTRRSFPHKSNQT